MNKRTVKISDLAAVVRSKNAGPFQLTLDVFFREEESFRRVEGAGVITPETVARLYKISPAEILNLSFFAPAWAIKITLKRPVASAEAGDTDVFGAQQHVPLLNLELELPE